MHIRQIKQIITTSTVLLALAALPFTTTASAAANTDKHGYVALGDSVAAGLGLPSGPGATSEDIVCGRSVEAYGAIVAATLKTKSAFINAACQGAVTTNLLAPQTRGTTTIKPQLDAAFAGGTPKLMTMTMGANDVHWAEFIGSCFSTTCDTAANTAAADTFLATLNADLNVTLVNVLARSGGYPPKVVLTGYYHPVSDKCVSNSLTTSEIAWLNTQTDKLNQTIKSAAQNFGFVKFAPIDFTGHDICSTDPWLQRPGVASEPAAFHPNAKGQQAMAKAVLNTLK